MTLELKPLGNSCNLGCTYCYQEPMRLAGNVRASKSYDLELMMDIADKKDGGQAYTLFGGEALLLPKKDLEYLLKNSYEKYGSSALQTNGSLITDAHVTMFKRYNVNVGISIDGPGELNSMRISTQKNKTTEELTQITMNNIAKLKANEVECGIIITVHKMNGTKEKLPRLLGFIDWLTSIGVHSGNLHMLEVDSKEASDHCLNDDENAYAFLTLAKYFDKSENKGIVWAPFSEMEDMQRSDNSKANCVWSSCDPMNTQAVYGIEGNGQISNCGMVNKEGIEWTKAEDSSYFRDLLLYQTPSDKGGCGGCPFFLMCNGYCPGSSIEGDWRNKTYYCSSLKRMFKYYEEKIEGEGGVPFSKRPDRKELEATYINNLISSNLTQRSTIRSLEDNTIVKRVTVPTGKRPE